MLCLAPVLLVGYLFTAQPNHAHTTSMDNPLVEVQTCETGPGLDLKVTTSGMGSLSAQYGFGYTSGPWHLTVTPKAGGAWLDQHVPELTSRLNFSLGLQTMVGYERARFSVEYWHQSNAGLGVRNAGLDMLAVMSGIVF